MIETTSHFDTSPASTRGNHLPVRPKAKEGESDVSLVEIRKFHLGGPVPDRPLPKGLLPALLSPFRDRAALRHDFPVILIPRDGSFQVEGELPLALSLSDGLNRAIESFAPAESAARLLKDNLPRVELEIIRALDREPAGRLRDLVDAAGRKLQSDLELNADNTEKLERDLEAMRDRLPNEARVLGFRDSALLEIVVHAADARLVPLRTAFARDLDSVVQELEALLDVERTKEPDAKSAESLKAAIGPIASGFLDPTRLSGLVRRRHGSKVMEPGRRDRIEWALRVLRDSSILDPDRNHGVVLYEGSLERSGVEEKWEDVRTETPALDAISRFDEIADDAVEFFRAVRTARLEIEDAYDPEQHGPWFEQFDWRSFSEEEIRLLPTVVAFEDAEAVATARVADVSRALLSSRPIRVFVLTTPDASFAVDREDAVDRLELGYFGISHRDAVVHQSSLTHPQHVATGVTTSLESGRPSLHVIATCPRGGQGVDRWLEGQASLEGRVHPNFFYDPDAGSTWSRRFAFEGNPQPDDDWPVYSFAYREDSGDTSADLAFTGVDYALLQSRLHGEFRQIPEGLESEDFVLVSEYLRFDREEAARKLPFIWAVDTDGIVSRYVVRRSLAIACHSKLDYWHTLQELAGIRNQYVIDAVEDARRDAEERSRELLRAEQEKHATELESVRGAAAAEAMRGLAQSLVASDPAELLGSLGGPSRPLPTSTPVQVPRIESDSEDRNMDATAPSEGAEDRADGTESRAAIQSVAWIDTPLCTSCNDCMAINPLVFVYDENKQAYLGDLETSTYAQMVEAAEKCPARCIHPGQPLDPTEDNLEELIERARVFD